MEINSTNISLSFFFGAFFRNTQNSHEMSKSQQAFVLENRCHFFQAVSFCVIEVSTKISFDRILFIQKFQKLFRENMNGNMTPCVMKLELLQSIIEGFTVENVSQTKTAPRSRLVFNGACLSFSFHIFL